MPEPESPPEPDDEAWAKASPRLKAIFRESLNEWLAENDKPETPAEDEGDDEPEDTDDRGKPAAAGKRGGRVAAAAAAGGKSALAPKRARQARPSGGSFLDIIIGR